MAFGDLGKLQKLFVCQHHGQTALGGDVAQSVQQPLKRAFAETPLAWKDGLNPVTAATRPTEPSVGRQFARVNPEVLSATRTAVQTHGFVLLSLRAKFHSNGICDLQTHGFSLEKSSKVSIHKYELWTEQNRSGHTTASCRFDRQRDVELGDRPKSVDVRNGDLHSSSIS